MGITEPLRLWLGWSNAYLVPAGDGCLLIDAGIPGVAGRVFRAMAGRGLQPEDIRLIVVTHVHLDHVGSLRAIQERCGAPVMVSAAEADLLSQGTVVVPGGTTPYGQASTAVLAGLNRLLPLRFAPCRADHGVKGGESLAGYGLDGHIVDTPGHTAGSITVLGENGDTFVGDLAVNHYPFNRGPIFPPFGDDSAAIYASWQKLLDAGARRIFPGHGRPFPAERLRERLAG